MSLQIKDLSVTYHSRHENTHAVKGVSLYLKPGEFVSLVGASGSGKSTVGLAIGRLTDYAHCKVEGSIQFENREVLSMDERALEAYRKKEIAYVFQEPATALNPVFPVGDQVREAMNPEARQDSKLKEILAQVRLEDLDRIITSFPHELSGGMKQRIMIAMALAKSPRILIADEPTTALDVTIQKEILELLMDLQKKKGMTILFITHDIQIASAVSHRILVMHEGKLVEEIQDPASLKVQHPYSRKLVNCSLLKKEPKTYFDVD
jgi:ABC-type dipeptide/oligopeptide/nickel transport system ATPase component